MKLILALTLISIHATCSLIDSSTLPASDLPGLPPKPPSRSSTNYTNQESQANPDQKPGSSLQSIKSLLTERYNSLLSESSRGSSPQNNSSSSSISSTLKAYQQQLLSYYRNNQAIPGSNGNSQDNIDNGENNTINGKKNVIKAGDYNTITGTSNTVNGSYNQIIGHNDVVHGTGNIVISNPQAISGFNFLNPPNSQTSIQSTHNTQAASRNSSSLESNPTESIDSYQGNGSLNVSNITQISYFLNQTNEYPKSSQKEESKTNSISFTQEAIQSPSNSTASSNSEATTTEQTRTVQINSNTHVSSENHQPTLVFVVTVTALLMITSF